MGRHRQACTADASAVQGRRRRASEASATETAAVPNVALVFIKPHAYTESFLKFVPSFLEENGVRIVKTGDLDAETIDTEGIIDQHYQAIAAIGMVAEPKQLELGAEAEEKFEKGYGKSYAECVDSGAVHTAVTALKALKVTPTELLDQCLAAGYEKLRSGLYCAKLDGGDSGGKVYVMNGFYARMREKFTAKGAAVRWFVVEFDPAVLSWKDFRSKSQGSTQPDDAAPGSIRAELREKWQSLGLTDAPNYQDNGVHASAGPLESVKERCLWAGDSIEDDAFVASLQASNVSDVSKLLDDAEVELKDGTTGSAFDLFEGEDASSAIEKLRGAKVLV
eukprot:CAMPEP_0178370704 /NCGR_PEP_ID=MMETSP0689_2-20121128/445_1 /TAXON_ID=160604 /ORGANISM="Amphidinium massartii, Strain CS-259" /LENGTH=335 /DNA_ID=CAMNT_0019990545 /DNA_START=186 /DNA_END=1194 /DNA_ORIENTATION=-